MKSLRLLFVLAILALTPLLLAPPPAWAYLTIEHTYWFSDDTYSYVVGEHYYNPCTSDYWSWGVTTDYAYYSPGTCIPHV